MIGFFGRKLTAHQFDRVFLRKVPTVDEIIMFPGGHDLEYYSDFCGHREILEIPVGERVSSPVTVMEKRGDQYRLHFTHRPNSGDWWMTEYTIRQRGSFETSLCMLFIGNYYLLKNLFISKPVEQTESGRLRRKQNNV